MREAKQIDVGAYQSLDGFMSRYQKLVCEVVIPYQHSLLKDEVEGAEKSHAIQNFKNAAKALKGEDIGDGFYGMVFQDSDLAKWIEAAAYALAVEPNEALEGCIDEVIEIVASAQDTDGYLNTYYTIKDRDILDELLREIFNPEVAFDQTEELDKCSYCDFKAICKR